MPVRRHRTWLFATGVLAAAAVAARADGPPPVAYLGIAAQSADPAASSAAGLPEGVGLTVTFVEPNGPAGIAHAVRAGDVLHKLDDQLLVNAPQMVALVQLHKPGDTVTLTVNRDGRPARVTLKLGERRRPAAPPTATDGDDERIPTLPGIVGPDPVTGRIPDDYQMPLPGTARTTVSFNDGTYSARVNTDPAGHKRMVVTGTDGRQVAAGPVDTPEQWNAFPADVRQHLQAVRNLLDGKHKGLLRHDPLSVNLRHGRDSLQGAAATRP